MTGHDTDRATVGVIVFVPLSPRIALTGVFFLNGAVLSSWAPRIPTVKNDLGLSEPQLGIALLGVAVGSVPTLIATGRLLQVRSTRSVCRLAGVVFAGALPSIGLADGLVSLSLALVVLGAASGALDVGMNTAAVELESAIGRVLMPGLHGAYSAGVLSGSVAGGAAAAAAIPVSAHFLVVSVVLLLLLSTAWTGLPRPATPPVQPQEAGRSVRGHRTLLLLVPLAISALLLEGALTDWTAVLASGPPFTDAFVAAGIIAAFSAAMTLSRALAARVLHAVGPRVVVLASSITLLVTVASSTLQPNALVLLGGTVLAGLAIGPLFPMVMSAAGAQHPDAPGPATARVTAWGYLAYLGGPPTVGFLAGSIGLPAALALVGVGASVVLLVLGRIGLATPRPSRHSDSGDAPR